MYYGIDLGTTYSAIGSGNVLLSDLVCSNVDVSTWKQVDRNIIEGDISASYKVNMTTSETGNLSRSCSTVILKTLADIASKKTGERVKDVIISVPAKFTYSQRQAVKQSGLNAGLNVVALINEPTAGAICVCKDIKDYVIVYDLGGGTFDVSVVDARAGIYTVLDTDGRMIAGDNFDRAILDDLYRELKIPLRKKGRRVSLTLTREIQKAKEALQKSGTSQIIDCSIVDFDSNYELTLERYIRLMKETFQVTIDLTKRVAENNTTIADKPKIVFVGGSTACPYLRKWVTEETGLEEIPTDIKPEYIVARGVAMFAEMLENGSAHEEVEDISTTLKIENADGTMETIIDGGTILPVEGEIIASNTEDTDTLIIKLYQGDSGFAAGCDYIGTLEYNYDKVIRKGEGTIVIKVYVDKSGLITLTGSDMLLGTEQSISIKIK